MLGRAAAALDGPLGEDARVPDDRATGLVVETGDVVDEVARR